MKYGKKWVIRLNYRHFGKKLRSVTVSQNHFLNKICDVHPLEKFTVTVYIIRNTATKVQ